MNVVKLYFDKNKNKIIIDNPDSIYLNINTKLRIICKDISPSRYILYVHMNAYTAHVIYEDDIRSDKGYTYEISNDVRSVMQNYINNEYNKAKTNTYIVKEVDSNRPLMPHQIEAVKRMCATNTYGFFYGTGTGKTLIVLSYILTACDPSDDIVIITTAKVVGQYKKECDTFIPDYKNILVSNYEQVRNILFERKKYKLIIFDESHKAKSFTSLISKNCYELTKRSEKVYIFTGSPQDKNRHEILAQIKLLKDYMLDNEYKSNILSMYYEFDDYYNPKSERKEYKEEIDYIINYYTYGVQTEDVVNVTPETHYLVKCSAPPDYLKLQNSRILSLSDTLVCVADNKAVLRLKLRELCGGHLNCFNDETNDNELYVYDTKDCYKAQVLKSLILTCKITTAIIGYIFDADCIHITNILKELGYTYGMINGRTKKRDVITIKEDFKANKINFLIVQCKAGAEGLDMPDKSTMIFYSLPESYIQYHQFRSRIRRIGQQNTLHYYYLLCEDTVDEQIYAALKRKKSFTNKVFKLYR